MLSNLALLYQLLANRVSNEKCDLQSLKSITESRQKPIPPPLPLPSHVTGKAMGSPGGVMSPRRAVLKRQVDDGMDR